MVRNLRPRQAAESLGMSLSSFYKRAKDDADFPTLVKLSPRCTVVRESDISEYLQKKVDEARRNAVPA